jgi:hypothetical protein
MTNSDLITSALRLIGVLNELETASPEQGTHALEVLNDLMADWEKEGVNLEYYEQDSLTADTPVPRHARAGVKYFLAFALAPEYGKQVTPEMISTGQKVFDRLVRDAVIEQVQQASTSHLPLTDANTSILDG